LRFRVDFSVCTRKQRSPVRRMRHQLLQPPDDAGAHQLGAPFAGRGAGACGDAEGARAEFCVRLPPVLQEVQDEGFADGARALCARRRQERGEDQAYKGINL
jgi:hypothetical protein